VYVIVNTQDVTPPPQGPRDKLQAMSTPLHEGSGPNGERPVEVVGPGKLVSRSAREREKCEGRK
jgi:hypothetical protein